MTTVHMHLGGISVEGHSGYAPPGKDIVCAGVSTLTQTLIKSIEDLTTDKIEYSISPDRVDINYENLSERSRTLVDSFFIGILQLAENYPAYVRIQ